MNPRTPSPESVGNVLELLLKHEHHKVAIDLTEAMKEFFSEGPYAYYLSFQAQFHARHYEKAYEAIRTACALAPEETDLKASLCQVLNALGRAHETETFIRQVLAKQPQWEKGRLELARCLGMQGKYAEAEDALRMILQTDPLNPIYKHQLSWYVMRQGQLREGQKLSVGLRPHFPWGARSLNLPQPLWNGGNLQGQRICLIGEGGIGDEVLAARFGKILQERGAQVLMVCKPELVDVFRRVKYFEDVVSLAELSSLHFDAWIPCLDACALLGLEYSELPQEAFLSVAPRFQKKWRSRLPEQGRLRVGIRWQGSPEFEGEQMRRVPASLMFDWARLPGVELFSLQKPLAEPLPKGITDLGSELETWEDTLAALSELDLVITTCSSVAHASAALGKPTWVVVPLMPYYPWAEPGERSRWYPSARVFRQERFGHWEEPCEKIFHELKKLTATNAKSHSTRFGRRFFSSQA